MIFTVSICQRLFGANLSTMAQVCEKKTANIVLTSLRIKLYLLARSILEGMKVILNPSYG